MGTISSQKQKTPNSQWVEEQGDWEPVALTKNWGPGQVSLVSRCILEGVLGWVSWKGDSQICLQENG